MNNRKSMDLRKNGLAVITVVLAVIFAFAVPQFANLRNINVIGIGRVPVAMFAMASLIPLAVGEFDISLGYMIGFLLMLGGKMASIGGTALGVVVVIMLSSVVLGAFNGLITVVFKIPSTISTLATGMIMYGGSLGLNGGKSFTGVTPDLLMWISKIKIVKLNICIWVCLAAGISAWLILEHSPLGKYIYAIGHSERVVALAGIRTKIVCFVSFIIASVLIGLCAVVLMSQSKNVYPDTGQSYLLPGLAVTFLSTTVHTPGRYNIPGVLWSAVFLGMVFNVISILGAPFWAEAVINGIVLLGVVLVMNLRRQK